MSVITKFKINGKTYDLAGGDALGISPTIDVVEIEGGHRLIITDAFETKNVDLVINKSGLPAVWFLSEFNSLTAIKGVSVQGNSLKGVDPDRTWTVMDSTGATVGTLSGVDSFKLYGLDTTEVYTVKSDYGHIATLKFAAEGSRKGLVATVPVGCNKSGTTWAPQIHGVDGLTDESFFVLSGYASTGSHQVISTIVPVSLLKLGYAGSITEHVSITAQGGITVYHVGALTCTFYLVKT